MRLHAVEKVAFNVCTKKFEIVTDYTNVCIRITKSDNKKIQQLLRSEDMPDVTWNLFRRSMSMQFKLRF